MRLKSKDAKGNDKDGPDDVVHYPWDAAMAALAAGDYDLAGFPKGSERGPDQPAAQSPAPGTDPLGGEEKADDGQVLTNLGTSDTISVVSPPKVEEVKASESDQSSAPKPVPVPVSVPAKASGKN